MSELIAARAKGELLERYEDEKESLGEDETESELVRDLLNRGLRDRRVPLVARLDLPNRVGARIEDERERGESEEEVVRRFLREAVDARDRDTLDAIGADDELRDLVEARREEGESLDDTVRRLVRNAAEDGDSRGGGQPSTLVPATLAATLAVSVTLLATGEGAVGIPLAIMSAVGVAGWGLARLTGWGAWAADKVGVLREGFQDIGGISGFFRIAWRRYKDDHPIDEPSTAVERAARLDIYLPAFFAVAFAVGAVLWGVVEAGLLPLIGPTGALIMLLAFILVVYAIPAAMVVAAAAQLAVAGVGRASETDTEEQDNRGV
jgi:hypothetical protein